jgi:cell division septation protein DedD
VTSRTHDEGFHEIQLNGKQLVFLFMAASVVAGVIFLLGVFVGRGVRAERGTTAQAAALTETPIPDIVRVPPAPIESAPAAVDSTAAAPTPVDDLSYFDRLDKDSKSADRQEDRKRAAEKSTPEARASEKLTPEARTPEKPTAAVSTATKATTGNVSVEKPAVPPAPAPAAVPAPAPATAEPNSTLPSASGAPGDGYAVQVAALNVRSEADAVAKRLTSKGYAAYVQVPPGGGGAVFRVRVGTFRTRRDAEMVAARLQKEERITPWVTR